MFSTHAVMPKKRVLSIRELLNISFAVAVLMLFLSGGLAMRYAYHYITPATDLEEFAYDAGLPPPLHHAESVPTLVLEKDRIVLLLSLMAGMATIVVLLMLYIIQRNRALQPIEMLSKQMHTLAEGNIDIDLPKVAQNDEVASMIEDLRVFKHHAEELQYHREHVQEIVDEQIAALTKAKEEAEHASHIKSEFLVYVSHELRTPMHAIINFSRIGIEREESWDTAKKSENLAKIRKSAERLLNLVNTLLNLSKLESGRITYHMRACNIQKIVEDVVGEIEILAEQKAITIDHMHTYSPFILECDSTKIHQAVLNLIANAIKFTPAGGVIDITYERLQNSIQITIKDEGMGIPESELDIVFNKFIQSSKTKTGAGGTGLGLTITKTIIEAHHGAIRAQNNALKGASFMITLPLKQPEEVIDASA